jgi:hypothetical protein
VREQQEEVEEEQRVHLEQQQQEQQRSRRRTMLKLQQPYSSQPRTYRHACQAGLQQYYIPEGLRQLLQEQGLGQQLEAALRNTGRTLYVARWSSCSHMLPAPSMLALRGSFSCGGARHASPTWLPTRCRWLT